MSPPDEILDSVRAYYGAKVTQHGTTARGVDWSTEESQQLRFAQLTRVFDVPPPFSVNDYGCGYGALLDFVRMTGVEIDYRGFDISEEMIARARARHPEIAFHLDASSLGMADYTIASGIFNVKLGTPKASWQDYVLRTIDEIAALSRRGFSFNMLTSYSDPDRMRDDLYYGDPCFYFDYCKRKHSRQVALLHDYGLYEFTIITRA